MHANIAAIMQHHHEMMDFSGICFVKQGDHVLFHEAYGLAHRGSGIPNAVVAAQLVYYPTIDTSSIILANQDCNVWSIQRELRPLLLLSKNTG
ncbi:MAG: hypothetical protein ACR2OU_19765 [Thermomicrobiales bacterium]